MLSTILFNNIKALAPEEIESLSQKVFDISGDGFQRKEVWKELYALLQPLNQHELSKYRYTYLRWYTILSWRVFFELSFDEVLHVLASTTTLATEEGEDVVKLVIQYLQLRSLDRFDMAEKYARIKDVLFASKQYITSVKNEAVVFSSFKNTLLRLEEQADTLQLADYISTIQGGIQQQRASSTLETDGALVIMLLQDVVHFFEGITAEKIYYIVDSYYFPQKYGFDSEGKPIISEDTEGINPQKTESNQPFLDGLLQHLPDFAAWSATEEMRQSLLDWMGTQGDEGVARMALAKQLQPLLPNIHEDIDTAGAIVELDRFLAEHGYSGKEEFLYFDDSDAGFHWHEQYL